MKTIEGMLSAKGLKLAIVVSRFNEFITSKLLGGAEDAIRRTGGNTDDVVLVWVPGAYEIPLAAQKLAESGKFDAVIALELSSADPLRILIMCARKRPKVLPRPL